jgi:hypothetical protein
MSDFADIMPPETVRHFTERRNALRQRQQETYETDLQDLKASRAPRGVLHSSYFCLSSLKIRTDIADALAIGKTGL